MCDLLDTQSEENAKLTVGAVRKDENDPLFREDKPWEPNFDNPYSSVIYDEEEKTYKCWYSVFIKSGPRRDSPGKGLSSDKRARVEWREGTRSGCFALARVRPDGFAGAPTDRRREQQGGDDHHQARCGGSRFAVHQRRRFAVVGTEGALVGLPLG